VLLSMIIRTTKFQKDFKSNLSMMDPWYNASTLRVMRSRDFPSRPGPMVGMGWDGTGKPKLGLGWARVLH
jgi:hypothetical protein